MLIQLSWKTVKDEFVGQACVAAGGCGWPKGRDVSLVSSMFTSCLQSFGAYQILE